MGTFQREVLVYYYYMGHLIQLSLVLGYFTIKYDFFKGNLSRGFIVPLTVIYNILITWDKQYSDTSNVDMYIQFSNLIVTYKELLQNTQYKAEYIYQW